MTDRELRNRLDHMHEMLHGIATTLAEVAVAVSHLATPSGGMTPEEVAVVTTKLTSQATALNSIAAAPPTTK